jgi:hypothetical protein
MFDKPLDQESEIVGLTENKNLTQTEEKRLVAQRIQSLLDLIKTQGKEKNQSGKIKSNQLKMNSLIENYARL